MRKKILLIIILISYSSYSQECDEKAKIVFNNIISSIGNNSIPEPRLKIEDINGPASFYQGNITIDRELINLFCDQKNFVDKISFVIAHELAHHFLQHNWKYNSGLAYIHDSLMGEEINIQDRLESETQADFYAGFYGKISGYKTLEYAKETITMIYKEYNIKKELRGYPSFKERLNIIDERIDEAKDLAEIFDIANVLLKLGEYEIAVNLYEGIVSRFSSREIYNNLAISYLLYGLENIRYSDTGISDDEIPKLSFPLILDFETRLKINRTRSSMYYNPKENIEQSKKYFKKALVLDESYKPSIHNLFTANFLLCVNQQDRDILIEKIFNSNMNEQYKIDFKVINEILKGGKEKKLKKLARNGSIISSLNTEKNDSDNYFFNSKDILSELNLYKDFIYLTDGWAESENVEVIEIQGYRSIKKYMLNNSFFYKIKNNSYLIKISNDLFLGNDELNTIREIFKDKDFTYLIHNSI